MTIKTKLHTYRIDTSTPEGRMEWGDLEAKLVGMGLKCHESWSKIGQRVHYQTGVAIAGDESWAEIELELEHLFGDQWNTGPINGGNGYRVMDWALDANVGMGGRGGNIKSGYWLEQTPAMAAARNDNVKCGYCGAMYNRFEAPAHFLCDKCLDSEYLQPKDLPLLRLQRINSTAQRKPLSETEEAYLLPRYRGAQIHGSTERGKARIAKARASVAEKYTKAARSAEAERDGMMWLLDHAPGLADNALYYHHTERWNVGWKKQIDAAMVEEVKAALAGFPLPLDLETTGGRIALNEGGAA